MAKKTTWGSFQNFVTWRSWVGAFVFGCLTLASLEAFVSSRSTGDGIFLVIFGALAVRSFLAFRKKARILIDFVEPHGA